MNACPTCSHSNPEGALFCEACGTYLHTGGTLTTNALESGPVSRPGPSGYPRDAQGGMPAGAALVLLCPEDGRRFRFEPRAQTALLGRNDRKARLKVDMDLTGHDGQARGISRRHARLHYLNGNYLLEDLESLNGTYLNERKLRPYLPEVLHNGDQVRLGDVSLVVSLEEMAAI